MKPNTDPPKASEAKPRSKPNAKDYLKSLPLPEVEKIGVCAKRRKRYLWRKRRV
jgi:hypothetical protein